MTTPQKAVGKIKSGDTIVHGMINAESQKLLGEESHNLSLSDYQARILHGMALESCHKRVRLANAKVGGKGTGLEAV